MKKTPLYEIHRKLKARMAQFAGWEMPISYSAISEEHKAVRERAGLFDISHMGEMTIEGPRALEAVRTLCTNNPSALEAGGCQYAMVLNDSGGVRDDVIVSKRSDTSFFICVNAGNTDKIIEWTSERQGKIATVTNRSASYGQLALQGPLAVKVAATLWGDRVSKLVPFHFTEFEWNKIPLLISRTGYTGEDGVEIYMPWNDTAKIWDLLMEAGRPSGILPVGLGARDTLRLEAALPLYGHELNEETNPFEAGLSWVVKPKNATFCGSQALQKKGILDQDYQPSRRLIGFEMMEPGIARQGYSIIIKDKVVGIVTSGTLSITLDKAVGLGYVPWDNRTAGTEIIIDIRGKLKKARVVPTPFVKKAYAK